MFGPRQSDIDDRIAEHFDRLYGLVEDTSHNLGIVAEQLSKFAYSVDQLVADAIERRRADFIFYAEETAQLATTAPTTAETLTWESSRSNPFKVTGIFVSVPFGTTVGNLQLGNQFNLPIQNTTFLVAPVQHILLSADIRQLTFTTGSGAANQGPAFVWLWGEEVPVTGMVG